MPMLETKIVIFLVHQTTQRQVIQSRLGVREIMLAFSKEDYSLPEPQAISNAPFTFNMARKQVRN